MHATPQQPVPRTVTVIGGGVAGMSAACALAEAGYRVQLIERRGYLGGRASSYLHPGVNEVIDNCQHVLFGCCTNLIGFYRRIGVENKIHWTTRDDHDRARRPPLATWSLIAPGSAPRPARNFSQPTPSHWPTRLALARAFRAMMRPIPKIDRESLCNWLRRNKQTSGRHRTLLATGHRQRPQRRSRLPSPLPYAAKVIRELFMNSAEAGSHGHEYCSPQRTLRRRRTNSSKIAAAKSTSTPTSKSAEWDEETRSGPSTRARRRLSPNSSSSPCLLKPCRTAAASAARRRRRRARRTDRATRALAHLQRASLVRPRDHRPPPRRPARPRDPLDVQQEPSCSPGANPKAAISNWSSAPRAPSPPSSANEAIDQALRELAEFFPAIKEAKLEKAALIKEVRATFGVPPASTPRAPLGISPWPNCFLAGDWIATGWPSTMESAARSRPPCRRSLCAAESTDRHFLEP